MMYNYLSQLSLCSAMIIMRPTEIKRMSTHKKSLNQGKEYLWRKVLRSVKKKNYVRKAR